MKPLKIAAVLISFIMVMGFAGCNGEETASGEESKAANATEAVASDNSGAAESKAQESSSNLKFVAKGKEIAIDMDTSSFISDLGDPVSYFEAESCAFQGLDKVYTYSDFVIRTYPDGDRDLVSSVELKSDLVNTAEGAYIGMTEDDIRGLYSSYNIDGDGNSSMTIVDGGTKLSFIFKDGTVESITYTAAE